MDTGQSKTKRANRKRRKEDGQTSDDEEKVAVRTRPMTSRIGDVNSTVWSAAYGHQDHAAGQPQRLDDRAPGLVGHPTNANEEAIDEPAFSPQHHTQSSLNQSLLNDLNQLRRAGGLPTSFSPRDLHLGDTQSITNAVLLRNLLMRPSLEQQRLNLEAQMQTAASANNSSRPEILSRLLTAAPASSIQSINTSQQQLLNLQLVRLQQAAAQGAATSTLGGLFPLQQQPPVISCVNLSDLELLRLLERNRQASLIHALNLPQPSSAPTLSQRTTTTAATTTTTSTTTAEQADEHASRLPTPLFVSGDERHLSPYQCLLRKQIEIFEATHDDVNSNAQGRNRPVILGQIGIRCRHCAAVTSTAKKTRGHVYFPGKADILYQVTQNMANTHLLQSCRNIPSQLRDELLRLRQTKSSAGGGKKYWNRASAESAWRLEENADGISCHVIVNLATSRPPRTIPESTMEGNEKPCRSEGINNDDPSIRSRGLDETQEEHETDERSRSRGLAQMQEGRETDDQEHSRKRQRTDRTDISAQSCLPHETNLLAGADSAPPNQTIQAPQDDRRMSHFSAHSTNPPNQQTSLSYLIEQLQSSLATEAQTGRNVLLPRNAAPLSPLLLSLLAQHQQQNNPSPSGPQNYEPLYQFLMPSSGTNPVDSGSYFTALVSLLAGVNSQPRTSVDLPQQFSLGLPQQFGLGYPQMIPQPTLLPTMPAYGGNTNTENTSATAAAISTLLYPNLSSLLVTSNALPGGNGSEGRDAALNAMASTGPASTSHSTNNRNDPLTLYLPSDDTALSPYQCLVRQQIELFEATKDDIESNAQGRNRPISVGQVGIRCRHCVVLSPNSRIRGHVYYPGKLSGIYQAAQNMAFIHLCEHCQQIPQTIRDQLLQLRQHKSSAGGGKKYWAEAVQSMGVYEEGQTLRLSKATG